jgi:hypothetical protein
MYVYRQCDGHTYIIRVRVEIPLRFYIFWRPHYLHPHPHDSGVPRARVPHLIITDYAADRSHVKAYASILPGPPHSFSLLSPSHGVVGTMHSAFGRASASAAALLRSALAPQKQ